MASNGLPNLLRRVWSAAADSLSRGELVTLLYLLGVLVLIIMSGIGILFVSSTPIRFAQLSLAIAGMVVVCLSLFINRNLEYLSREALQFLRKKFGMTKQKRKEGPFIVSERYAEEINGKAVGAYLVLGFCLFVAITGTEYVAAGIVGAAVIAIAGFGCLTKVRAENGWFADNRYEVLELLQFVIAKSKSGGLPPGSRVSRLASEVVQVRTSPTEEAVGSRA